jgi:galactoside O-acetyltransferase
VDVGPWCRIVGRAGVEIGNFVALTACVHIYSATNDPYHPDRLGQLMTMSHTAPEDLQHRTDDGVSVGEFSVIGMGAIILPGVSLGRGVIVHAVTEVATSFPKFALVSGPGRARRTGWRRPGQLDPRLESSDT